MWLIFLNHHGLVGALSYSDQASSEEEAMKIMNLHSRYGTDSSALQIEHNVVQSKTLMCKDGQIYEI